VSDPQPEGDGPIEISLGRYVHRVLARWYVVVACVILGAVVALAAGSSSSQTYSAKALIFLGLPYTPNGQPILSSPGSNPATPGILVNEPVVIATAAAKAGLRPGQLRGAVSTQVLSSAITKTNYTPFVDVIVRGPWRTKTQIASNAVAEQIVALNNGYQAAKYAALQSAIDGERAEQASLKQREAVALRNLQTLQSGQGLSAVEKALAQQGVTSQLNSIQTRLGTLDDQLTTNLQSAAMVQYIERNRIVTRARATAVTASSRRASLGVALLLGLVLGVVLALASYLIWPARDARPA
jgi:hypothetical protein